MDQEDIVQGGSLALRGPSKTRNGPVFGRNGLLCDFWSPIRKMGSRNGPFFLSVGRVFLGAKKHEILKIHKTIQKTMDRPTIHVACGMCFHEFMCFLAEETCTLQKKMLFFFSFWAPIIFKTVFSTICGTFNKKKLRSRGPLSDLEKLEWTPSPFGLCLSCCLCL